MAEVGFKASARKMPERDKCFLMPMSVLAEIPSHLDIAAAVAVFVAEASVDLGGGVSLPGRGGFIVLEDLVDERLNLSTASPPWPH